MAPDNFLYHYQTLLAGIAALGGGACVLFQAFYHEWRTDRREKALHEERRVAFTAIVFSDLIEFESELKILKDQLIEFLERLGAEPSIIRRITDLTLPSTLMYIYEDWRSQIGFEPSVIASLWILRSDLKAFEQCAQLLKSQSNANVASMPLFRGMSESEDLSPLRTRIADLVAAADNVLSSIESVAQALEDSLPSDLAKSIRKGNVDEVALAGLQGRYSQNRSWKAGTPRVP
jgi:hypothetical protein